MGKHEIPCVLQAWATAWNHTDQIESDLGFRVGTRGQVSFGALFQIPALRLPEQYTHGSCCASSRLDFNEYQGVGAADDEIDLNFPVPPVALQNGKASGSEVFLGAVLTERPKLCPGQ